jgi:cell division transport system permease protein
MVQKALKKYTYDISLDEGIGAHLVGWVTGLMVFFVTLALAFNFGLSSVTKNWVTGLSGTLTVEIKPQADAGDRDGKKLKNSARKVLAYLKKNDSVAEARLLTDDEIKSLIQPWIGNDAQLDNLPLPSLIDVKLAPEADILQLQKGMKMIEPSATIDSHTDTLDDVRTLINTASLFVLLLTGVIIVLAIVAISGIVRSKLAIHLPEVETLHLIGASDEYIARQFRQHTLRGTLKGALTGVACTVATLLAVGAATHTVDISVFPHLSLLPWQWAALLFAPIAVGSIIAHLTAQATVLRELARLP